MSTKLYVCKFLRVNHDSKNIPTFACKVCGDYFTATEIIKHWYETIRKEKIPIDYHTDDSFLADTATVLVKAYVEEQQLLVYNR